MSPRIAWSLAATVLLLLAFASPAGAAAAPETAGATFAASASAGGELADGVGTVEYTPVQISEDGRYVSFQSASRNLGEAGPEGAVEGFVKDLDTGQVELVSRADGVGGEAAGAPGITTLQMSGNGRYVLFTSAATNLGNPLPEEAAGETHVYRRDLVTGETTLVDRVSGANGQVLARGAEGDAISADGRVVAFTDRVANLEDPVGDHTETAEAVGYVRNLETGATTAISRADGANGELADRGVEQLWVSPEGRYVSFTTFADNIGSGIESYLVYLRDTEANTTTLVGVNAEGEVADSSVYGGFLAGGSGCYGTVESEATNLLPGTSGGHIYVFDRCGAPGKFTVANIQEDGTPFYLSFGSFDAATVTADGTKVLLSGSDPGASSCPCHLYLRDLAAGTTTTVDRASGAGGELGNGETQYFALSANGCRAAFETTATNLVPEAAPDPGEDPSQIYVRQLAPCHSEAGKPPVAVNPSPPPGGTTILGATRVGVGHLSRKVLWLSFDGPGKARLRIQKLRVGRRHGWKQVKALAVTAAAAGEVKVKLPALGAGRYRFKVRLQGDPDSPTLTKRLSVGG
jgi:hypothetical protein